MRGQQKNFQQRGSAVITVLVLAAVTAVIAAGFISRATSEARIANRAFYNTAALHLAEAGVEEALYDLNTNAVTSGGAWSLASGSTTDYVKTLPSNFGSAQATGEIRLRIDQAASNSPVIIAAGVVLLPGQPKLVKQIRVGCRTSSRIWSNTLVARGNITLSGNADIDSYDSARGPYNPTTNRSDRATVATTDQITLTGRASIYGYVATGGTPPNVGKNGRIYGATTTSSTAVDSSRVRSDFNANLSDAAAPSGSAYNLGAYSLTGTSSVSLPRATDLPGPNGRYLYTCTSLNVGGSARLTINGPVDIVVSGNITVGSSGFIAVGGASAVDPSLNLYSPGTISIGGAGLINNTNLPIKTSIWGTKASSSSAQNISVTASAAFYGTLYAANGDITLSGSGGIFGAVIGRNVNISGSTDFHYDIQLANATSAGGPTPAPASTLATMRIASWAELTAAPSSTVGMVRDNRSPFVSLF